MGMNRRDFMKRAVLAGGVGSVVMVTGLAGCTKAAGAPGTASSDISLDSLAALVENLQTRLHVAEAKEAIRYKLCLYCRGDDRQDAEIGKKAFSEDSYVDYGTSPDSGSIFKGTGWDWVEYCANTVDKSISASGGFYAHVINNITITVNGDKAGSETYVTAPVMTANEDGTYNLMQSVARYCDKWECRDGDWLIVERHTTNDFGYFWQSPGIYTPYDCSFDKKDPSYEALAYGE